jgi:hypothetical protein
MNRYPVPMGVLKKRRCVKTKNLLPTIPGTAPLRLNLTASYTVRDNAMTNHSDIIADQLGVTLSLDTNRP